MTAGPWIAKRRKLRKKAQKKYRRKNMGWIRGRLCFLNTGKPVPRVPKVPKPKRRVYEHTPITM